MISVAVIAAMEIRLSVKLTTNRGVILLFDPLILDDEK